MIVALVCGAGVGAGLWLVVRGLYPPRPSLAQALAPYDSATGQLVLVLVGGVFATAFVWLARMTRPAQVDRFLTKAIPVDDPGFTAPESTSGMFR